MPNQRAITRIIWAPGLDDGSVPPGPTVAVVDGTTFDAIGDPVTESIGVVDGVTRTTTRVGVSTG